MALLLFCKVFKLVYTKSVRVRVRVRVKCGCGSLWVERPKNLCRDNGLKQCFLVLLEHIHQGNFLKKITKIFFMCGENFSFGTLEFFQFIFIVWFCNQTRFSVFVLSAAYIISLNSVAPMLCGHGKVNSKFHIWLHNLQILKKQPQKYFE